jgi:hypothetical protein
MNLRKIAREWKRAGFVLVIAVAAVFATSGCDALNAIGRLSYYGEWLSSTIASMTSSTTTS